MLFAYLKAVFVETSRGVFTVFDVLGIALFLYPELASFLTNDESRVRIFGGLMFLCSFILANFLVYRQLASQIAYRADIRLDVAYHNFGHSLGSRRSPFREVRKSPGGFNEQGLPDWATLHADIRIRNIGYETGNLDCGLDKAKTNLPSFFDLERVEHVFDAPSSIPGRTKNRASLFLDILFSTEDPRAFAQCLGNLIKPKRLIKRTRKYQVVLRYRTRCVDGESKTRRLYIRGDFQSFYQSVLEYWDKRGYDDLVALARSAAS